jgi:HD-GYP domain-containing protein (c-di-GMP phosphodiesterase class II)
MSIRVKQLLLLLAIALIPVTLSGWHSIRQIDAMAASVASSTRAEIINHNRHYLTEKVADIGKSLQLMAQSTGNYLRQQQVLIELAMSLQPQVDVDVLFSNQVPESPDAVAETRFSREGDGFDSPHVKVIYQQPSFLLAPGSGDSANDAIQSLAAISDGLKGIYQETSAFTLWHYAALDVGVGMVYPGHGEYPKDYDPRQRHWYQQVKQTGEITWMPLTIDASTGQPVITVAAPLRSNDGAIIGATAIDLPLRRILNFETVARPWLNRARLALLRPGTDGKLAIVAMKEPLELDSDWHTAPQARNIEGLSPEELQSVSNMARGESQLLDTVSMTQENYMLAITALSNTRDSWLALASPSSAIEIAVQQSLASLEQQRQATLERHIIGACMLAAIVALIALIAANRVTAPLIAMSQTTEAIAAGNLDSRIQSPRKDEIGLLSRSIDHMADSIQELLKEQEKAYRDMIITLTRALEKKDSYTAAHSGRVTRYSLKIGKAIGLDEQTLEKLRFGAITHDLGKIGIADNVLNKPAPLDDAEYEIMKQHPSFSKTIMKPLSRFREYAEIAGSHHEHWNGGGYPDGLKGEEIPLLARIVSIADAWDAMTGDRIYRKGMPVEKAISILDAEKDDGQFDPELIRAFIELVRKEYKLA